MAVEITVFRQASTPMMSHTAPLTPPVQTASTTFTNTYKGIMRIYCSAAPATITIGGIAFTVPIGTIEYFGVQAGTVVTVT